MDEIRIERIEKKVDTIDQKQDQMNENLARIDVTLQYNHQNWVEHMRRTEANEQSIEIQRQALEDMRNTFTKHLSFVKGATWFAATLWIISIALIGLLIRVFV